MIKQTNTRNINQNNQDSKVMSFIDTDEGALYDLTNIKDCTLALKNLIRERNLKQIMITLANLSNEMIMNLP